MKTNEPSQIATLSLKAKLAISALLALILIGTIGLFVSTHNAIARAEKAYDTYLEKTVVSSVGMLPIREAAIDQAMSLPVRHKLKFGGVGLQLGEGVNSITISKLTTNNLTQDVWHRFRLTTTPDDSFSCYGDVNLATDFGIPVILHVQTANKQRIIYTVTVTKEVQLGRSTP